MKDLKEESVKLEPTTIEELTELKSDIVYSIESKEKLNEENLLKLLKVLARKKINIQLLRDSGIGKILTRIRNQPGGFFSDDNACKDKA